MISMHHEIRTPLTIVLLGIELGRHGQVTKACTKLLVAARLWGKSEAIIVAQNIQAECKLLPLNSFDKIYQQIRLLEIELSKLNV